MTGTMAVTIEVIDDGTGAEDQALAGGHGLTGMRERVSVHGGELSADPDPRGGYALHATLPL